MSVNLPPWPKEGEHLTLACWLSAHEHCPGTTRPMNGGTPNVCTCSCHAPQ